MMLGRVLSLSPFLLVAAAADSATSYVRKLKKEESNFNGEDGFHNFISIDMLKPFDTSQHGLPFGDWVSFYNGTASTDDEGIINLDSVDDDWNHGATAVSAQRSGSITFQIPETTHVGDTLFLFLSRTDGVLPLSLDRWNRGAECFKSFNRQQNCMRAVHCTETDGPFCRNFIRGDESGNGRDLATVVYYRHVEDGDPCEWTINLPGGTTTWAIVVSIPNVNREQPIIRVAGTSCDRRRESVFPSVYGDEGNLVLLSQSFDDTATDSQFQAPDGTELVAWTNSQDEAGFVYGKKLNTSGLTGQLITQGTGGPLCKDALLSIIINIDDFSV